MAINGAASEGKESWRFQGKLSWVCGQTLDDVQSGCPEPEAYQRTALQASEEGALEQTHLPPKRSHPTIKNTVPRHSHPANIRFTNPFTKHTLQIHSDSSPPRHSVNTDQAPVTSQALSWAREIHQ